MERGPGQCERSDHGQERRVQRPVGRGRQHHLRLHRKHRRVRTHPHPDLPDRLTDPTARQRETGGAAALPDCRAAPSCPTRISRVTRGA
ncbi:hypothetical protein SBRY_50848 [Actinacidiphila bryophytorum]|uniref:Uncharacterized protein n=1 Tax=Actinacidiphila bryophytorum TaxID=1436133 RepID=A0A9W4MJU4_9ACTN|nr:hypothetical protein SBRY_50848 [Actinacidiphila bryophytorum]